MGEDLAQYKALEALKAEHHALDERIMSGNYDQLALQRLKRQKLQLKDEISKLEGSLYDDIIA